MSVLKGSTHGYATFLNGVNVTARHFFLDLFQKPHDKVCLVDSVTKRQLKLSELAVQSMSLAAELQSLGAGPQKVIGILSENRLEYLTAVVATLLSGATLTTFNPANSIDELRHTVQISRPSIVFCSSHNLRKLKEASKETNFNQIILLDDENLEDTSLLHTSRLTGPSNKELKLEPLSSEDIAVIFYSSGTTGLPKGVMTTHKNLLYMIKTRQDKDFHLDGAMLSFVPSCHVYGLSVLFSSFSVDGPLVLMSKFEERFFLQLIQEHKIEILFLVPTIVKLLLKSDQLPSYDTSSVKCLICGGAVMGESLEMELKTKMNVEYIQQAYAMTEAPPITIKRLKSLKKGTCGTVAPATEVKVIDIETSEILGANQSGELCVKGPQVTKGYLGNENATRELIDEDGWLHTGDMAYYDEDGYFYIVDRLKDLIKYKANQVSPAEIEAILVQHEGVLEASVIGIPDYMAGEIPKAFVTRRTGSSVTEKELVDYVAERVSPQKRLRGGVTFVDSLPKNASGKILKRELKKQYFNQNDAFT